LIGSDIVEDKETRRRVKTAESDESTMQVVK